MRCYGYLLTKRRRPAPGPRLRNIVIRCTHPVTLSLSKRSRPSARQRRRFDRLSVTQRHEMIRRGIRLQAGNQAETKRKLSRGTIR
ncbi:hypothetical protein WPS_20910 [Vulcanimicrobium alpinum]|uniref:Uncharacterized protein n=1 Tax=Vulcanimicrobium alpinum TaxID=3016050 RepID=A0AAN1XWR6_UNVUL|nr:hypothetical protein WPS_20910 [Vulcanimicrobium alpinum]